MVRMECDGVGNSKREPCRSTRVKSEWLKGKVWGGNTVTCEVGCISISRSKAGEGQSVPLARLSTHKDDDKEEGPCCAFHKREDQARAFSWMRSKSRYLIRTPSKQWYTVPHLGGIKVKNFNRNPAQTQGKNL